MSGVCVGLLDGALASGPALAAQALFAEAGSGAGAAHAAGLAASIAAHAPDTRFRNAVIFGQRLTTGEEQLVAALDWLLAEPPDLVLCSFGLRRVSARTEARFADLAQRAPLIASAPARGPAVFPAALPFTIAVQGDARCAPGEWSHLALPQARFGAHVVAAKHPDIRGASAAAAHFCGHLARRLSEGATPEAALGALAAEAPHQGPERRTQ